MAQRLVLEFKSEGFEQILTTGGTMNAVTDATAKIRSSANANNTHGGKGFGSGNRIARAYGCQRALGFVYTTDLQSRIAESEDKALSRAVR